MFSQILPLQARDCKLWKQPIIGLFKHFLLWLEIIIVIAVEVEVMTIMMIIVNAVSAVVLQLACLGTNSEFPGLIHKEKSRFMLKFYQLFNIDLKMKVKTKK